MPWPFRGRRSEPEVVEPAPELAPIRFRFAPQPDITALELAVILAAVVPEGVPVLSSIVLSPGRTLDPRVARHFRPDPGPVFIGDARAA